MAVLFGQYVWLSVLSCILWFIPQWFEIVTCCMDRHHHYLIGCDIFNIYRVKLCGNGTVIESGAIEFGDFLLASGARSSYYIDIKTGHEPVVLANKEDIRRLEFYG